MEYAKSYWNNRYSSGGNSGYGSYDIQLTKKLKWLSGLDIKSVSEIGCGDFNFGSKLMEMYPKANYFGYDISDYIIEQNKIKYPSFNFSSINKIPPADLVLCIDVLFHTLDDNDYEETLNSLERLLHTSKYLAVTSYEYDQTENLGSHVRIRNFDYKRFGTPLIREVCEEDGQLYFYLFKAPEIKLQEVTAILNTKEPTYPKDVLKHVSSFPFGEILIKTGSDSPYAKYDLFNKAKYSTLYYQDDDAICPITQLCLESKPEMINIAMKPHHYESYQNLRMSMGLGWGSFFTKEHLKALKKYTDKYGEDDLFKRDTEKILTQLVYPQNRIVLPIIDTPEAMASDRLSFQPHHYENMTQIEQKCSSLI